MPTAMGEEPDVGAAAVVGAQKGEEAAHQHHALNGDVQNARAF